MDLEKMKRDPSTTLESFEAAIRFDQLEKDAKQEGRRAKRAAKHAAILAVLSSVFTALLTFGVTYLWLN